MQVVCTQTTEPAGCWWCSLVDWWWWCWLLLLLLLLLRDYIHIYYIFQVRCTYVHIWLGFSSNRPTAPPASGKIQTELKITILVPKLR